MDSEIADNGVAAGLVISICSCAPQGADAMQLPVRRERLLLFSLADSHSLRVQASPSSPVAFLCHCAYDEVTLPWRTNLPSFKPAVDGLFQRLYTMIEEPALNVAGPATFLQSLHRSALANSQNWQERLDVYLQCLSDRRVIDANQVAELLALASKCPVPLPTCWTVLSPVAWIVIGSFSLLGWLTYSVSGEQLVLFVLVTGLCGGYLGWNIYHRPKRQPYLPNHGYQPIFLAGSMAAASVCLSILLPELAKELHFAYVKYRHTLEVKRFSEDPEGMPKVRKLAKEQFGVNLVLNYPDNNWVNTALALPGLSSPASTDPAPGHCILNIDRNSLRDDFGVSDAKMRSPWIMGVLIHEISHCADMGRDLGTLDSDSSVIATHSLAPSAAIFAKDIQSYIQTANQPASRLWREAYADIAAIGYWKVAEPVNASSLGNALRQKRVTATDDVDHMTTCWIDHALSTPGPPTIARLPQWADEMRSTARCKVG
jgi:hypothetical protein